MPRVFLLLVFLTPLVCGNKTGAESKKRESPLASDNAEKHDCSLRIDDCHDQSSVFTIRPDKEGEEVSLYCSDLNGIDDEYFFGACQKKAVRRACGCTCGFREACAESYVQQEFFSPLAFAGGCFSGDSMIETTEGPVAVSALRGMKDPVVKVIDSSNQISYSPVRVWLSAESGEVEHFELRTESGHKLTATAKHLVYEVPCDGGERNVRHMDQFRPGQCVLVVIDGAMVPSPVSSLSPVLKDGRYTFTTDTGTVVVDGVAASNYGNSIHEKLGHWFFTVYYYIQKIGFIETDPTHSSMLAHLLDIEKWF